MQYARALRYADALEPCRARRLFDSYAEEALVTGLYEESVDARLSALGLYRELGDQLRIGETLSRLTNAYTRLGRNQEAEEASLESIRILESCRRAESSPGRTPCRPTPACSAATTTKASRGGRKAVDGGGGVGDRESRPTASTWPAPR